MPRRLCHGPRNCKPHPRRMLGPSPGYRRHVHWYDMTNERIRKLTDGDLLQACRAKADAGSTFVDTNLAEERRKVTEYYMGKRPLQSREGGSKFVSQDVYLSVETMKSEIVETFGAGSQIVAFRPVTGDDVPLATLERKRTRLNYSH